MIKAAVKDVIYSGDSKTVDKNTPAFKSLEAAYNEAQLYNKNKK